MAHLGDGTAQGGGLLWYPTTASNTTTIQMPTVGWIGAGVGGSYDPLARVQPAEPKPETNEQWLRRRVREVQWAPA